MEAVQREKLERYETILRDIAGKTCVYGLYHYPELVRLPRLRKSLNACPTCVARVSLKEVEQ
jgi:hypothetical protein